MRLFRHGDEKQRLEVGDSDFALFGQRMNRGQNNHHIMVSDAFPCQGGAFLVRGRGPQANKAKINLARLKSAKLLSRRHIKKVDGDFRGASIKSRERCGQEIEIELEEIAKVQLSRFAAAEALHGLDA